MLPAIALVLGVLGGVIFATGYFTALPTGVESAGIIAFLVGGAIAVTLTYRVARREGMSAIRAIGSSMKALLRWIFEFG